MLRPLNRAGLVLLQPLKVGANVAAVYRRCRQDMTYGYGYIPIKHARSFSNAIGLLAKNKLHKDAAESRPEVGGGDKGAFDQTKLESDCESTVKKLQKDIQDLKAGRRNPDKLNNLKIPSQKTILSTLAAVTQKNPKTYVVTVFDPVHVKHVSSAIAGSGENFNPQPVPNNPTQLTINIPQDSSSAKSEKVKTLQQKAEQARVHIRAIRGEQLKDVKKSQGSKDEKRKDEKTVGSIIERFGKEIDALVSNAKKDLESS